jgi:hypothetical protein
LKELAKQAQTKEGNCCEKANVSYDNSPGNVSMRSSMKSASVEANL